MKIDRRKCRKYADPGLKMSSGNGLLYAEQISYIVRAAVKLIGHKRILVLYVYSREEAAEGCFSPLWTVFQGKEDYAVLARREDGTLSWRVTFFAVLDGRWDFVSRCAFYTQKDEERIKRFFQDGEKGGFPPLLHAQRKICRERNMERQRNREGRVLERMKDLGPLPRGLAKWAHRSVMPAYFFYDYKKGAKNVEGTCSSCGKETVIAGARHNREGVCPACGREVTMKARGRRGCLFDRVTLQTVQKTGPGEVVVRIVKCCYTYRGQDTPEKVIFENARLFVRTGREGVAVEGYYDSYNKGILTSWRRGYRPAFSTWQYCFAADLCGHLYCGNLPEALEGTPWQYCPADIFYGHDREPMELAPFLKAYTAHPRLEHLVKTGFWELASGLAYGRECVKLLDEGQNRTHRLLRVAAEDVPFLRSLDPAPSVLEVFQEYCGHNLKDRRELLLWQIKNGIWRHISQILEYMTPHKLMGYLEKQYSFLNRRRTKRGGMRYSSPQDLAGEYRDYLEMCVKLGYDMKNSFVLYPRDLQKAHDSAARRVKRRADAEVRRDFQAVYVEIAGQVDFEADGMKIVSPAVPGDIIAEGHALHHCVGGYVERVAKRESIILFLRQCAEENKPFYTIELQDRKVVQVRGMQNCSATPEVKQFLRKWEKKVLAVPGRKMAA